MPGLIPAVKIPDYSDSFGVRSPNRKLRSRLSVLLHQVRAQLVVQAQMGPLVEEMEIVGAQYFASGAVQFRYLHSVG